MRYVYLVRVEGASEVEEGNVRRDGSRSSVSPRSTALLPCP